MDSFELNKILGAILGTCLVLLVTSFTANALFAPKLPEKPGYSAEIYPETLRDYSYPDGRVWRDA